MYVCFSRLRWAIASLLLILTPVTLSTPLVLLPVSAQTKQDRKAEGDRLFQKGIEEAQTSQVEAAAQFWQQALSIYREIEDRQREEWTLGNLGLAYEKLGNYTKAIEYYQQVLIIARHLNDRQGEGDALEDLGSIYDSLGKDAKAIEYYQQSLAIMRNIKNHQSEGKILIDLGLVSKKLGKDAKAIEYYQQALAIAREIHYRQGEGSALGNLGNIYLDLGNYAKAVEHYQEVLVIAQEIHYRQGEGSALGNLGTSYRKLGNYTKAIEYAQQALVITREIKDRQGESNALGNLGSIYDSLGNYAKAIEYHQQALVLARELQNHQREGEILIDLAIDYKNLSKYTEVIECAQQALMIARKINYRHGEGSALENLGMAYFQLGNYGKAVEYVQQALTISQETHDREGEGSALGNLGVVHLTLGNATKAIEYEQQALVIKREMHDRGGEGSVLANLANAYLKLRSVKAVEYAQQSLAIDQEIHNKSGEGVDLGIIGSIYQSVGNYAKAIEYQEQLLAIAREVKDRQGEGAALGNLGTSYYFLGNYSKAIEYEQQHLTIAQEIHDRQSEGLALNNLGAAQFKSSQLRIAEQTLRAAIQVWETLRQDLENNDANKVSIFEQQAKSYGTLQKVLVAQLQTNSALEIAERGRARALVELLAKQLAAGFTTDKTNEISNSSFSPTSPSVAQIQQLTRTRNTTLVEYSIIYDDFQGQKGVEAREFALYLWVIQPDSQVTFRSVDLKPLWQQQDTSLAKLVESSRKGIGVLDRSDRATLVAKQTPEQLHQLRQQQTRYLRQLHQLLIEPIADLLPSDPNAHVIFMPQESLFLVPFAALMDKSNQYLIQQHTISVAPAIQVLQLTQQQRQALPSTKTSTVLVAGNPMMPQVTVPGADHPLDLPNLPGAEQEAIAVASTLNTKAIIGKQAVKSAIVQQMQTARIIHLATHGLLDDFKGLGVPGAIALAPDGNGQLNDGLLTADDILGMKLQAELVVLSACNTGGGNITGDGVIGLSRSLISAGVPSVIVSLWSVPDAPTAALMANFYTNLKTTPDKAQALRQAMLNTMKQHPDPRDWSAFTLIGEAQ